MQRRTRKRIAQWTGYALTAFAVIVGAANLIDSPRAVPGALKWLAPVIEFLQQWSIPAFFWVLVGITAAILLYDTFISRIIDLRSLRSLTDSVADSVAELKSSLADTHRRVVEHTNATNQMRDAYLRLSSSVRELDVRLPTALEVQQERERPAYTSDGIDWRPLPEPVRDVPQVPTPTKRHSYVISATAEVPIPLELLISCSERVSEINLELLGEDVPDCDPPRFHIEQDGNDIQLTMRHPKLRDPRTLRVDLTKYVGDFTVTHVRRKIES